MFDAVLYIGVRPERKKNVHSFKTGRSRRPRFAKLVDGGSLRLGGHFPRREINAHSRFAGAHTQPFNIAVRGRDGVSPPCLVEESSGRYFRSGRERSPFVNRGNSNRKMRPPREGVRRWRAGHGGGGGRAGGKLLGFCRDARDGLGTA